MKLESALDQLERREQFILKLCKLFVVITIALMILGGSEVLGGFDPWNANANILSITLGIIYVIFAVSTAMLAAYYFSNLRPTTRQTRDTLFQHSLSEMAQALDAIREEVRSLKDRDAGDTDQPIQ
ncbi:hypothetical protein GC176_07185 [bacterium]|nr:hypothetical protein [bacterium]